MKYLLMSENLNEDKVNTTGITELIEFLDSVDVDWNNVIDLGNFEDINKDDDVEIKIRYTNDNTENWVTFDVILRMEKNEENSWIFDNFDRMTNSLKIDYFAEQEFELIDFNMVE